MNIEEFRLPRYAQIPDVGLYLEQVVRYVNFHLAMLGEPALTSSMVSNYVKQRLIPAPQKKLYTAQHLARLIFIAVVKPVHQTAVRVDNGFREAGRSAGGASDDVWHTGGQLYASDRL